jgi:hypothetical protein
MLGQYLDGKEVDPNGFEVYLRDIRQRTAW